MEYRRTNGIREANRSGYQADGLGQVGLADAGQTLLLDRTPHMTDRAIGPHTMSGEVATIRMIRMERTEREARSLNEPRLGLKSPVVSPIARTKSDIQSTGGHDGTGNEGDFETQDELYSSDSDDDDERERSTRHRLAEREHRRRTLRSTEGLRLEPGSTAQFGTRSGVVVERVRGAVEKKSNMVKRSKGRGQRSNSSDSSTGEDEQSRERINTMDGDVMSDRSQRSHKTALGEPKVLQSSEDSSEIDMEERGSVRGGQKCRSYSYS